MTAPSPPAPVLVTDIASAVKAAGGNVWFMIKTEYGLVLRFELGARQFRVVLRPIAGDPVEVPEEGTTTTHVVSTLDALRAWLQSLFPDPQKTGNTGHHSDSPVKKVNPMQTSSNQADIPTIDHGQPMTAAEYTEALNTLTDPATSCPSPSRIALLSEQEKDAITYYLVGMKLPIIAGFVTANAAPALRAAGYTDGYHNPHFTFWIQPEQAILFTKSEPLPAAGKQDRPSFRSDLHQAIDMEMEPDLDEAQPESETEADGENAGWSKPQPIKTSLLSVLSVRPSMIPEPLRDWLTDISDRMKCPLDFVASAAVVMISSLIGTRLSIKPKARDDWTITPNLWGAAIGDPSTMKTPSITEVFKPLNRLIAESRKQFEEEMQQYEAGQLTYEAQKKVFYSQEQDRLKSKKVDNPVAFPDPVKKPTERRYMTNDATIEKLADLLNENPTGVLQFRDELIGLLAGWERSGREEDRSFYLEAWNGSGFKTVDRIGRGTIHVKNLCVSLYGGVQPTKLLPYLQAATSYDNDGFVQRLQVAVFPDKPVWGYTDELPDKRARDKAYALIKQIADSDFASIAYAANDYDRFPYTHFDNDAQEVFKEWVTEWQLKLLPNESGLLLEHFTKYNSLMPSLALVFHVVNTVDNPPPTNSAEKYLVSVDAALMAIEWCTYLQSHARRIYGLLDNQQVESAKSLLSQLKAGKLKDEFKAGDVQRKGWANLSTLDMIESALAELIDHYWLKEVQPPPNQPKGGRPPAPHYLINPVIIQKA